MAVSTGVCSPPQDTITAGDPPNLSFRSRAGRCLCSLSPCPSRPISPLPQVPSVPFAVTQAVCLGIPRGHHHHFALFKRCTREERWHIPVWHAVVA